MSRRNSACDYFAVPYPYVLTTDIDFTLCARCGWNLKDHQPIDTSKVMPTLTETPKFSSNTREPELAEISPDYSREESWGEHPDLPKRREFEVELTEISPELYRQLVDDTIKKWQPALDEMKRRGD